MPPRAHYCRTCKRVVLRMDHHCMFVNTCIGHRNHHYFLRFLLFLFASTCYVVGGVAWTTASRLADFADSGGYSAALRGVAAGQPALATRRSVDPLTATPGATLAAISPLMPLYAAYVALAELPAGGAIMLGIGAIALLALLFSAALLFVQLRNLRAGRTYIESCRSPPTNEFDLGLRANLRATFGARRCGALLHLLPLPAPPVGDGMRFESRPRARVV